MTVTLGIDPGQHGAIAVLSRSGESDLVMERVDDLHTVRDGSLCWIDGGWLQSVLIDAVRGRRAIAIVERVSSRPGQGVASSFQFGVGFGSILSVLQARHIPLEFVTAATWKRALGLSKDKRASLDKARLLYPDAPLHLAKHDGRAEALLIAHWWQRQRAVDATRAPTQLPPDAATTPAAAS